MSEGLTPFVREILCGCLFEAKDFPTLAILARTSRAFRGFGQPLLSAAEEGRYSVENEERGVARNTKVWRNGAGRIHRGGDKPAAVYANGRQEWWHYGKQHRDGDRPAVICANGHREWWHRGEKHRAGDQPAVIYADGSQEWWWGGGIHRDGDQPAVIQAPEYRAWYRNGQFHRDGDLPAVIDAGEKQWWRDGKHHRDGDHPAILRENGCDEWWRDNRLWRWRNCAQDDGATSVRDAGLNSTPNRAKKCARLAPLLAPTERNTKKNPSTTEQVKFPVMGSS